MQKIVLSVKTTVDVGNFCDDKFLFAGEFCSLRFIVSFLHCHCQTQVTSNYNWSCLKIWCILSLGLFSCTHLSHHFRLSALFSGFPGFHIGTVPRRALREQLAQVDERTCTSMQNLWLVYWHIQNFFFGRGRAGLTMLHGVEYSLNIHLEQA